LRLIQLAAMTVRTPITGAAQQSCYAIDGALKRRGVFVMFGVEPSDRPDGLFDMIRAPPRWFSGFRVSGLRH